MVTSAEPYFLHHFNLSNSHAICKLMVGVSLALHRDFALPPTTEPNNLDHHGAFECLLRRVEGPGTLEGVTVGAKSKRR